MTIVDQHVILDANRCSEWPAQTAAPQFLRGGTISSSRQHRINRDIRVREVRLIDEEGKQMGIYPTREALRVAEERGFDLVEIAPQANPPVCRLLDYGKYMYELHRREREARKAQKQIDVKEIQIRPKTADHDIQVKLNRARKFLGDGAKVRVRVRFRGREHTHPELGDELMEHVVEELGDVAVVESRPKMEGSALIMILSPAKKTESAEAD